MEDFLSEGQKKPMSYHFKSDGRKHDPQPQIGKGALLLPGAYNYEDLAQRYHNITACLTPDTSVCSLYACITVSSHIETKKKMLPFQVHWENA